MGDYKMFFKQFWEMLQEYGVALFTTTILSGLTLGYLLHYVKNVRPLKKAKHAEKQNESEFDEHISVEEPEDGDSAMRGQKQIGIVKGMINSEVFSTLRRKPIYEGKKKSLEGSIKDTDDTRPLFSSEESKREENILTKENTSQATTDESDDDGVVVVENSSGRKKSDSFGLEGKSLEDHELMGTLGKLHGKLATAQLRARTRRMQADMTAEERDDEAKAKAKQLESIMALMMENKEKFGLTSEDDIKEQLNMYNF